MGTNITGIGNANAIGFKSRVTGGMYFPPELKDALVGVWSAYGKSNNSTDRNIIKNKIKDKGGDFVISNAAYKLNSGFGKYEEDFTAIWTKLSKVTFTDSRLSTNKDFSSPWIAYKLARQSDIKEMTVKISGIPNGGILRYLYIEEGNNKQTSFDITKDGIYKLPASYINEDISHTVGFHIPYTNYDWTNIVIEQIPSFEGAFVTDGIDDLITSTKTVQEMGITDEITVVSMIHQIGQGFSTNNIRNATALTGRSENLTIGKTGIYGWSKSDIHTATISNINNILGDKNDYSAAGGGYDNSMIFSVEGYKGNNSVLEVSSVAWYWTFIANRVLTTDEINQVIAYYNLDKYVKPDVYYDVKKQGLSNNTPDKDWYLKDYGSKGRDMKLFNFAKKLNSGIGLYKEDFTSWFNPKKIIATPSLLKITNVASIAGALIYTANSKFTSLKLKVTNVPADVVIKVGAAAVYYLDLHEGINDISYPTNSPFGFFANKTFANANITIEQIPDYEGALVFDGVDDYGKATGLPIYNDYTVIADRQFVNNLPNNADGGVALKGYRFNQGAFVFDSRTSAYSFGNATPRSINANRIISYQSKYTNNKVVISAGTTTDTDELYMANWNIDSRFAKLVLHNFMLFQYSLSEFLIERQLKKHKLGTLYPNMVEFRPIIKQDDRIKKLKYYKLNETADYIDLNIGDYIPIGRMIMITIDTVNTVDELVSAVSSQLTGIGINGSNGRYNITGALTSESPQNINITIDEYIKYEDIVQPYPALLRFNDENGNEVSWGGKFRVGSTITRIGSIDDTENNLLNGLYSTNGLTLNGKAVTSSTSIVEKQMVFKTTATYLLDNNEPKVILSPSRLRIPNSSYKILGHIPDISGHGNHGVINNSAYAEMSGANGYVTNFKNWQYRPINNSQQLLIADSSVSIKAELSDDWIIWRDTDTPKFKIRIIGLPTGGAVRYRYFDTNKVQHDLNFDSNGIWECPANNKSGSSSGFATSGMKGLYVGLTIEQIGEYEGAYCLDGVDDFVTIPTLSIGGKQVLIKTNWLKSPALLYDQRALTGFAILTTKEDDATNPRIAYQARNLDGKTYIDGIENNYIETYSLKGITHNITVTNPSAGSGVVPVIGANTGKSNSFAEMALYDFMLFDEVSTDEEIKQLNDIVGIEGDFYEMDFNNDFLIGN